jgi:signal transduction histidine kinase
MISPYLTGLAETLALERTTITAELAHLQKNVNHIKDIVAMQQSYARTSGVAESIVVTDLVEDALRINAGSLLRHDINVVRDYQARPNISLEKHKVLQVLVNLVRNAEYACDESGRLDKEITLRTTVTECGVSIAVIDNGIGIPQENLTRIFAHGFTTRKDGHGFGLHSGALAAREMGGTLTGHSAGPGKGASFILELPYKPEAAPREIPLA